jgi:predicted RNA-binding Zn-ribbon protein involved in translation (DUF1610 family)
MAEIKVMWLHEPDPTAPDLVVEDAFECPTCGLTLTIRPSHPRTATLRTTCPCGTDVEILQTSRSAGDDLGDSGVGEPGGFGDGPQC